MKVKDPVDAKQSFRNSLKILAGLIFCVFGILTLLHYPFPSIGFFICGLICFPESCQFIEDYIINRTFKTETKILILFLGFMYCDVSIMISKAINNMKPVEVEKQVIRKIYIHDTIRITKLSRPKLPRIKRKVESATTLSSIPHRVKTRKSNPIIRSRSGYIRGRRGGCYYINSRGNKVYVDRSLCN